MTDVLARLTTSLADRYRIERELGAGGMATVYLAHDVRHDRKVALKVLRPELAAILGGERFLHEIRTTANLQHPHILPLHDSGEVDGTVFYVMPFVDGESLRDRLQREKQLPLDDALRIARETADALAYAHEKGIVHRDIKPENILLHGGHAMVADFGIALAVSTVGGGTRMTETGMSLGTPHYMAPEQAMGDREITPRADIYALGCVAYEMLTGEPPFTGSTAQAIVARVVTESPRSMVSQRHTIPPHVEATILKALEKLPADRFATAKEFADALDKPGMLPMATAATQAAPVSESIIWRRRLGHVLLRSPWLAIGAALGFAGIWWQRPRIIPPPVVRFAIPLPNATTFSPTLSPDGSQLVFVGFDSIRNMHLYLRPMSREEPALVPGTEGMANSAYFSPDGRWIVFRQGPKMRKIAVAGGATLAVADIDPGPMGGMFWGDRDMILFSQLDTLYRVPAAGGRPEALLGPDSASGALRYFSPHVLPGGRRFIATRVTPRGPDLVVVDIDSRRVRPLGISGMSPQYINAGRLLYVDGSGTLLAVPFDADRGRVSGAAEPVAENVTITNNFFARYSVSRTGTLVYFSGAAREQRDLVLVDRSGLARRLPLPEAAYRYPRFSPDGRRIAVGIQAPGNANWGDIWDYDFASQRLSRLTFDTAGQFPEWTPDGRSIVYARRQATNVSLYRVAADGSTDAVSYFRRPSNLLESRLTPDGRYLVFREDHNLRDILVAPVDSPGAARPLAATPFNERSIALSPDGQWLAFVSNLSGSSEVYVRRLGEGSPRWKASLAGGVAPRWGPGGRELFYRNLDTLFVVSVQLGSDVRLGEPRALFFAGAYVNSANEAFYDVSPDGRQFIAVRANASSQGPVLRVLMHRFEQPSTGGGSQ